MFHGEQERLEAKLREVRELAGARLAREELGPFLEVLGTFYANVSADEFVGLDAEAVYGASLALWKFAAKRTRGEPRVRV